MSEKYFDTDGVRIIYQERGRGKVILFLPGVWLDPQTYDEIIQELAKKFLVITLDLTGLARLCLEENQLNMAKLIKILGLMIEKNNWTNCTVIGHSFGGGVGLVLASNNRQVKSVIAVDSMGAGKKDFPSNLWRTLFIERTVYDLKNYRNLSRLGRLAWGFWLEVWPHLPKLGKEYLLFKQMICQPLEFKKPIKARAIFIWGRDDELITWAEGKELQALTGIKEMVVVSGNHDWLIFNPGLFMETVGPYLKSGIR